MFFPNKPYCTYFNLQNFTFSFAIKKQLKTLNKHIKQNNNDSNNPCVCRFFYAHIQTNVINAHTEKKN